MSDSEATASNTICMNGHSLPVYQMQRGLRAWGIEHLRSFPWRMTNNPFHMLLAELMLRRTQARQVVPVYTRFATQYPDAQALLKAPSEEVASLLFPLGLAWRVPAFQQVARVLVDRYNGMVPQDYDALLTLPGVGDYVASAICCFAFGQALPIIDTNTGPCCWKAIWYNYSC